MHGTLIADLMSKDIFVLCLLHKVTSNVLSHVKRISGQPVRHAGSTMISVWVVHTCHWILDRFPLMFGLC